MWSDLIGGLYADAEFAPPASDTEIDQIEGQLGQPVPNELRDLLRHANGVQAEWGSGLVWTVQEIIDQNIEFRRDAEFAELYMSFDQLMFFGDNGGGGETSSIAAESAVAHVRVCRSRPDPEGRSTADEHTQLPS
ncbi:SMI1/KNR4 family protein [Nocardia fluminea]|uniref:SMI1/KNR4 family protein n=1 Tax=Nocardia fluminea TaxID=134984 RepID=UPI003653C156